MESPRFALERWPKPVLLASGLLLVAGIGLADYFTGWEISLFVFYAVPIGLILWHLNTASGLWITACCGVVWVLANQSEHPYHTHLGYALAAASRLVYFLLVVVVVSTFKKLRQTDAERLNALKLAKELESEIVRAGEREQQRIGQDLHDGLCQELAAIGCAARSLADDLRPISAPAAADAETMEDLIKSAVNEARSLARGIFPARIAEEGLGIALQDLAVMTSKLAGLTVECHDLRPEVNIDSTVSLHLYRIAQEAVANAVRHSQASRVTISLDVTNADVVLMITDNGSGLHETGGPRLGMGVRTMQHRAATVQGNLVLKTSPSGGMQVVCTVPRSETSTH